MLELNLGLINLGLTVGGSWIEEQRGTAARRSNDERRHAGKKDTRREDGFTVHWFSHWDGRREREGRRKKNWRRKKKNWRRKKKGGTYEGRHMKRRRSILSGTVSFNNFFLNPAVKRRRFTAGFKKKLLNDTVPLNMERRRFICLPSYVPPFFFLLQFFFFLLQFFFLLPSLSRLPSQWLNQWTVKPSSRLVSFLPACRRSSLLLRAAVPRCSSIQLPPTVSPKFMSPKFNSSTSLMNWSQQLWFLWIGCIEYSI